MMQSILQKSVWAIKRILFIIFYLLMILSGGIIMYVFAPVTTYFGVNEYGNLGIYTEAVG